MQGGRQRQQAGGRAARLAASMSSRWIRRTAVVVGSMIRSIASCTSRRSPNSGDTRCGWYPSASRHTYGGASKVQPVSPRLPEPQSYAHSLLTHQQTSMEGCGACNGAARERLLSLGIEWLRQLDASDTCCWR